MGLAIRENVTGRYITTIKDELDVAIPAGSLTTLLLTLYDRNTGTIINSRNKQNVLNTNGVTVDSAGQLIWTLAPVDNIILNAALNIEYHVALFEWTYAAGVKRGVHEVVLAVQNLSKNP